MRLWARAGTRAYGELGPSSWPSSERSARALGPVLRRQAHPKLAAPARARPAAAGAARTSGGGRSGYMGSDGQKSGHVGRLWSRPRVLELAAESAFGLTALDHVRCRQGEGLDLRCPRGLGLSSLRRPLRRHQQGLDRRGLPTGPRPERREGRHRQTTTCVDCRYLLTEV